MPPDELAVTHEIVPAAEHHAEETAVAAETAVVAAETAVALANATAASAELQAAEREAEVIEEVATWQDQAQQIGQTLAKMSDRLSEIDLREAERATMNSAQNERLERLEASLSLIEAAMMAPLTPENSDGAAAATETAEGDATLATAGVASEAVSGSASLPVPEAEPERAHPAENQNPLRRKKRFI